MVCVSGQVMTRKNTLMTMTKEDPEREERRREQRDIVDSF